MKVTDSLSKEHRVIEQVLQCLAKIVAGARSTGALDIQGALSALRFLRTFADSCHHEKEEHVLFPALAQVGFSKEAGPVAVMLEEHERGRKLLARMEAALANVDADADALWGFAEAADAYVTLLTQHISKEDHILFPVADGALVGAAAAAIRAGFANAEARHDRATLHAEMVAIADALGSQYGVARATGPSAFLGCHHAPAPR